MTWPFTAALALQPEQLGVVVKADDPVSLALADAYLKARGVPPGNRVEVTLPATSPGMGETRFTAVRAEALAALPDRVQALLLVWMQPWRVRCMAMTTAFAAGYDEAWCAKPCGLTRRNPYYDSDSRAPADDHDLLPAMMLAAPNLDAGLALIRRGVAADGSHPAGTGYLVETSDRRRNVRAWRFPRLAAAWRGRLALEHVQADAVRDRDDVLFYFTGLREVPGIGSNRYLPGAIADHLTSGGGHLVGGRQMSILRWLEVGATASYGAVAEPCNYPQKFPDPEVVVRRYHGGDTLIEAYWKSVLMPGQGVFVGEPLARPFAY